MDGCVKFPTQTISICILSSMDLQAIVRTEDIMERTLIVSRLSGNKVIDSLVCFTLKHSELVCMREGLLSLSKWRNTSGKFIGPVLRC